MNSKSQRGVTSIEYLVACAVLVAFLGIATANDASVLRQLVKAFRTAYQNYSHSISLPE